MMVFCRVCLHLLSQRGRWTILILLSAISITLTLVLPYLDQHYPIGSGELVIWPSTGLSRIAGSRADWMPPRTTQKQVQKKGPTAGGSRNTSTVLNGPPMEFFRDNLRNDTYYLTAWSMAGFTNEFINYVNMIYLAVLTDRIPIIPPFAPDHHIPVSAGVLPFGDIFDLDALSDQLRIPVLEWRDVKLLPTTSDRNPFPYVDHPKGSDPIPEPLGCWSTRAPTETEPIRAENVIHHIGVDPAYTRLPFYTRLTDDPGEVHIVYSRLAALIYRSLIFSSAAPSRISPSWEPWGDPEKDPDRFEHMAPAVGGHHRRPESHLSCFDALYFMTSGAEVFEWRLGFSPVWRSVGRWLRFNARTHDLVREYLDDLFGGSPVNVGGDPHIYPFIAVHIRRGDFSVHCGDGHCFPALSVYARQVEDVRREIYKTRAIAIEHVVVTANEESPTFWNEVRTLGWFRINHQRHQTLERYGIWYPIVIDVVVQSYALGLVGTEDSTLSMVSQLRVLDWNGGVVRSVNMRDK